MKLGVTEDSPNVLKTGNVRRSHLMVVYFLNILLLSPRLI